MLFGVTTIDGNKLMGYVCGISLEVTAGPSLHNSASTIFSRAFFMITAIYYESAKSA